MADAIFAFEITRALKKKAKKRRIKNEKKWVVLRWASSALLLIAALLLVAGIFFIDHTDEDQLLLVSALFAVCLIVGIIIRALISNLASHWIDDRLNEQIWVKDGYLHQFIQKSFAAGANYRRADERATVYEMEIASIHNAKYDPKSGRIEFNAVGRGVRYADYQTGAIDKQWHLTPQFTGIFYDYTEPSLYAYLSERGIEFTQCTIDFKLNDARV